MTAASVRAKTAAPTLIGIQALRFVAAMLVVVMHGSQMAAERLGAEGSRHDYWVFGAFGVHIFFVISGVVMALSTRDWRPGPGVIQRFMVRRVIRILPMYWLATTLKLASVLAVPAAALHTDLSFGHLSLSYLLVPHQDSFGEPFPLLGVGWTLSYEFFFYFVFAALVALGLPLISTSFALFFLMNVADQVFDLRDQLTFFRLFSPLLFEFSAGLIVARLLLSGWRLPAPLALGAAVLGFYGAYNWVIGPLGFWHNLQNSVWAFLVVIGVTSLEPLIGRHIPRWLRLLGDASFALYLFHPFVMAGGALFVKLGARTPATALIAASLLSVLLSVAIYKFVEQPMTEWLRRRVEPRRPPSAPAPDGGHARAETGRAPADTPRASGDAPKPGSRPA
ncbi:acyltransferase family protein [Derxia gummosa]|uniref:Acyltransferase family protein n=1 Tax=Derxia gummosa DSM 723 TaxID=1121388 RepID=A0A8B6X4R5_9BURK|nr:acyltransferase [Derxia gummosa]